MRRIERGTCQVEGCHTVEFRKGWCVKHLRRWEQWGDPLMVRDGRDLSLIERFTLRYKVSSTGCWIWTAGRSKESGYSRFAVEHRTTISGHRWSYLHHVGPIPDGYTVDHTCHNADPTCKGGPSCLHRRCVNPAHLEAVPLRTNLLRGNTLPAINAAKTHCPRNHPYDGVGAKGERLCRTCRSADQRRYLERKRSHTT